MLDDEYLRLGKQFPSYLPKSRLDDITINEIMAEAISDLPRQRFYEMRRLFPKAHGVYFLFNENEELVKIGKSTSLFDRVYNLYAERFYDWSSVAILIFSKVPTKTELNFAESFFHYQYQPASSHFDFDISSQFFNRTGKINSPISFESLMRMESMDIQSSIVPFLQFVDWEKMFMRVRAEKVKKHQSLSLS